MEPLVPALPSTNEYEETSADNGKSTQSHTHTQANNTYTHACIHTYTHTHIPAASLGLLGLQ